MKYIIPNFKRDKNNKKTLNVSYITSIMIVCAIFILLGISILCLKYSANKNSSYSETLAIEKINELSLREKSLSKFFNSGNLYYSFETTINNEIINYYLPDKNITIFETNNINKMNKIVVFKETINLFDYNKISHSYDNKIKEIYYYEIYINTNTKINDLGEIKLEEKNNNFAIFPFFYPIMHV